MAAVLFAALSASLAWAQAAPHYVVDYGASSLVAVVGKSGMLSFAGHEHAVLATKWNATLDLHPTDLPHSMLVLTIPVNALVVDSPEARQKAGLDAGPKPDDVRTIQRTMLGPEVLDAARYSEIMVTSTGIVLDGTGRLRFSGDLRLHGKVQHITVPVRYTTSAQRMTFDEEFTIRQTDFGITPITVAGGTIKVKNEVKIRVHVVLVAAK